MRGERWASSPSRFSPERSLVPIREETVENTVDLEALKGLKNSIRFQNLNPAFSSTHTSLYTHWAIPHPNSFSTKLNSSWSSVVLHNDKTKWKLSVGHSKFQCQFSSSCQETKCRGSLNSSAGVVSMLQDGIQMNRCYYTAGLGGLHFLKKVRTSSGTQPDSY